MQYRYPTLMKPLSAYRPLGAPDDGLLDNNALIVKGGIINYGGDRPSGVLDASRHQLTGSELERLCPSSNNPDTGLTCFMNNHLQMHLEYQPSSRIFDFHLIVGTGYLSLAAVALAAVWLIVRRTDLSAG